MKKTKLALLNKINMIEDEQYRYLLKKAVDEGRTNSARMLAEDLVSKDNSDVNVEIDTMIMDLYFA